MPVKPPVIERDSEGRVRMLEGKLGIRAHRNATLKSSRPSLISLTDGCHRSTSMCSSPATSSPTYCSRMASMHSGAWHPRYGWHAVLPMYALGRRSPHAAMCGHAG